MAPECRARITYNHPRIDDSLKPHAVSHIKLVHVAGINQLGRDITFLGQLDKSLVGKKVLLVCQRGFDRIPTIIHPLDLEIGLVLDHIQNHLRKLSSIVVNPLCLDNLISVDPIEDVLGLAAFQVCC